MKSNTRPVVNLPYRGPSLISLIRGQVFTDFTLRCVVNPVHWMTMTQEDTCSVFVREFAPGSANRGWCFAVRLNQPGGFAFRPPAETVLNFAG